MYRLLIRHSMDVIKRAVEHLNPGQVPVLTVDQPLFAIAKIIQWNWPESYGEDKFVVLLSSPFFIDIYAIVSHLPTVKASIR